MDAFFHPGPDVDVDGARYEVFEPTRLTASVWADTMQHGAPPAALMVRALERACAPGLQISRVTIELLGVVPITQSRVRAWVSRPGRAISLFTAEVECADRSGEFRPVARAHAWALSTSDTAAFVRDVVPALPADGDAPAPAFFEAVREAGFLGACEWRFVPPAVEDGVEGARHCWVRARVPLVAGEEPTDLVRVFSVIDAANGISARMDPTRVTWMNMDMTVHLHRAPRLSAGWVGIAADQQIGPEGLGATASEIYDADGHFARGSQTLLVAAR
ncbi:thioesterase family protein [Tsukamurella sp. 8F]|uniref:thioesterase family protein n=1 Tax=unclassified Tsukamurella TaxID=2633480 RepID=UPI0023B8F514|nr:MULTISPECIES: thioesterase family protein [unclassified Tsukamurella]MDF0530536.1 thioesterase family protein [Tsukamurella sp. 8J]MDF0586814.1 thioesterase family protein [Tsukamurella sp. 8F]